MYRILIADDEGIMLYSLQTMIQKNLGGECEVYTAKTGRAVVDMAQSLRPDIIFMDIQMPGMNGIEAMQAIRMENKTVLFIVITAYSKFDYAKEAIEIGVFDFLTKPVNKDNFLRVIKRAMAQVDVEKNNQMANLRIREKLDTVVPIMESGFINYLMLQTGGAESTYYNYKELLDIEEETAYVILIQFGESYENGVLTNPVGMSMRSQKFYPELRDIVKEHFNCIIGAVMANKVIVMVPDQTDGMEYEERIKIIGQARNLLHSLEARIDAKFRIGIGRTCRIDELNESYQEAFRAIQEGEGRVVHVGDMPLRGEYEGEYPIDNEQLIFQWVIKGDIEAVREQASIFFDWMVNNYSEYMDSIRLKVLELIMRAEMDAFLNGGLNYGFLYRKDYLSEVQNSNNYDEIRSWWLKKITDITKHMANRKKAQSENIVSKAIRYIEENYRKDISLDDVSREVNINPYYFSKRFKEETGVNFIDYLTGIRINKAKELLEDPALSIKEICTMSGYSDPNYFSRIFKKIENITPSDYREKRRI
ncbi:response regulator [Anaerocolumna sp. AGMB13025]|uniref:response regulator n=1 Tax=Anaerocolumna sp. AGMB13025 TaxID=3039116 RepID=UPI00241E4227|nr:response regulator [Anaerocolumna sp. AGMB13025]WFR57866.1 response regulator [Anaerocolumna sp. AGMB13025]